MATPPKRSERCVFWGVCRNYAAAAAPRLTNTEREKKAKQRKRRRHRTYRHSGMRGAKPFLLTGSLYFPHINWRCKFVTLREFVSRATICMTCSSDLGKFYAYSPAFLRRFQDTIFPLVTTTNERARFPPDQISPKLLPSRTLLPFSSSSVPCQNDKRNLFFPGRISFPT